MEPKKTGMRMLSHVTTPSKVAQHACHEQCATGQGMFPTGFNLLPWHVSELPPAAQ